MAELTEVIKLSKPVKTDLEGIKEKGKHSTLDSAIRVTIERNGRLEAENELFRRDLQECRKENRELKKKIKDLEKKKQSD